MDVLLHPDLKYSWHPGCGYISPGYYCVGPIGRIGPGTTFPLPPPTPNTEIPTCLAIYIEFPNKEVQEQVVSCVRQLVKEGDDIQVIYPENNTQIIHEGVKMAHLNEYCKIQAQNEEIGKKWQELSVQLEQIGCDVDDCRGPKYVPVPREFYITRVEEILGRMEVRCKKGTRFYDHLHSNGILEKVYPQWYRDGNY